MNAMGCGYEDETIRALETDARSASLIEHQKSCASCRDAVLVAQALRQDANKLAARYTPPSSVQMWATAARHRRMAALERASSFVFALKIAGLVYAAVLIVWGVHALVVRGIVPPGLDAKWLNATITGAGLAVLFVGSGLWYTLRGDSRRVG
jgi:predicted anti-sigma-YlaC factor YlaD